MAANPLEQFNSLTVGEARRLLSMVALENGGLDPSNREECHCSHCTHKHKKKGNTPSLSIKPRKKVAEGQNPDESQVGRIQCRGSCGFEAKLEVEAKTRHTQSWKINTVSKYLEGVLPDPQDPESWRKFWTSEKVSSVFTSLRGKEKFKLGLIDFKRDNGIPLPPGCRESSEILHSEKSFGVGANKSPGGFLCEWGEIFGDALEVYDSCPQLGMTVCGKRGWKTNVLREMVKEGLISLKPSPRHDGDIVISFAYKGLVESPPGLPCRLIKTRHLFATSETDAFSRRTIHPGVFSALLGDFTKANTLLQNSKRVVFVEGEPDAISWRHMHPEDGIVCVGDVNEYKPILECLPSLNLAGKEIVYVHDRDQDSEGRPKMSADGLSSHHSILTAMINENPSRVLLWMCPQKEGKEMKDPNDFLKAARAGDDILSYAAEIYRSEQKSLPLARYQKTFHQLFSQQI